MIILTIEVNTQSCNHSELLSGLRFFTEKIRAEKGCQDCHIYQDINDENLINLKETWKQRSDLDEHLRSDTFSALMGAMRLLGKTYEVQINDGTHTEGMEAVKRAQSKKDKNGS